MPLLKAISFIIASLPSRLMVVVGRYLGRLVYLIDGRHRKVALDNLRMAFGQEKTEDEIRTIARGVFENIAITSLEFMKIPWLGEGDMDRYIECSGLENLKNAFSKGRGVILYTAHLGNWELLAAWYGIKGYRGDIVVRPLDSPLVEGFVRWIRTRCGNAVVYKKRSMRRLIRTLSDNGLVGILLDQNVTLSEGVFVDFFGIPACTNRGLALLAMKTGSPVIPTFIVRTEKGHRIVIEKEIETLRTGDKMADVVTNTQRFTRVIEDMIRRYPDQWFWVHRRWKTRPPGKGKTPSSH